MIKIKILSLLLFTFLLIGCKEDTIDISEIQKLNVDDSGKLNDTTYVKINPDWDSQGFNNPKDILIGRDQFIYVADTDNDRIVMMNLDGKVLSEKKVKRPIAIAQDYLMNLIVCAEFDTTVENINRNYSAIFKIDLVGKNGSNGHNLNTAQIKRVMPASSYDFSRTDRKYTGVSVFYDNSYVISRKGPSNNNLIDPDNAILIFKTIKDSLGNKKDIYSGKVPLLSATGTGLMSANNISSLSTFNKRNYDILVTLNGNNSFKTQWLKYISSSEFSGYSNMLSPSSSELMSINKFSNPEDALIDDAGNIFVIDAAKDSLYKFNNNGDELQSFGGKDIFNSPNGIAFYNRILYVADTGNNRILRFVLSTELD